MYGSHHLRCHDPTEHSQCSRLRRHPIPMMAKRNEVQQPGQPSSTGRDGRSAKQIAPAMFPGTCVSSLLVLLLLTFLDPVLSQGTGDDDISSNTNTNTTSNTTTGIFDCSDCPVQTAILFPWFVQLLGCCALYFLTRYNLPFPFAAVMFVLGACMGAGVSLAGKDNALANSIKQWANIDSQLLLLIFLPGLIFKDAVEINLNLFLVALAQIWVLAFPMVLVGTGLTAAVCVYLLPYEWPWVEALTLGAILASTDPIAVSSVLKTAGASPRLVMHISGESLLNDGSSFVFFTIFSQLYYEYLNILPVGTEAMTVSSGFVLFIRMSLGGTLIGCLFGLGLLTVLRQLDRRMEREFDVLQVVSGLATAYLCFYVCDQILTMSGVVACVTLGVVVNAFGKSMINDERLMGNYLTVAEYCLNTLLFTLGGVIWASISFEDVQSYRIQLVDWGWLFILYVMVLMIRFIQVGIFYPVISRIGLKSNWKEATFLAYGGLRGAVGVALGLSLTRFVFESTEDDEARQTTTVLLFMAGGVTLLTLSINGTSAGYILQKLGLAKPSVSPDRARILFEGKAKDFMYQELASLLPEARFENVDFSILKEFVPFVTEKPSQFLTSNEEGMRHERLTKKVSNARNGEQYLRVLDATTRASSRRYLDPHTKKSVLVEMRQVFLELLGEAYKVELDTGELDEKEDNGFMYDILIQSVALANNDVEHNNSPIEDWQYTEMFRFMEYGGDTGGSSSSSLDADRSVTGSFLKPRRRSSLKELLSSNPTGDTDGTTIGAVRSTLTARRIRYDVLRAIAFKEGHEMAQTRMLLYSNRLHDLDDVAIHEVVRPAIMQCLEESREQVKKAEHMLKKEISKLDLEIVMSHYCARILIRRLMKFTERAVDDGLLGRIQGRKYLKDMDERIRNVLANTQKALLERNHDASQEETQEVELDNVMEDGSESSDDGSIILPPALANAGDVDLANAEDVDLASHAE